MKNVQKFNKNKTRVSIGMPVFNGEEFIEEALNSILNQKFSNFKLIISDNASTDQTQEICLKFKSKDPRITYYRNKINIGGPNNYNRVFELSSAEYFKWAAYDDVLAPNFLGECVSILDNDPSIVGCHCKTGQIDQSSILQGYFNEGRLKRINSPKIHERFRDLLDLYYTTTIFHGVYRSCFLDQSQLHGSYTGADRNLVAELSLMGRIYTIPQCLFFWRLHPQSYTSIFYTKEENTLDRIRRESSWWTKKGSTYFPYWKNAIEYVRSVNRVSLKFSERLLCYNQIFDWFMKQGRRFMAKDIFFFLLQNSNLGNELSKNISVSSHSRFKNILEKFIKID